MLESLVVLAFFLFVVLPTGYLGYRYLGPALMPTKEWERQDKEWKERYPDA